MFTRKLFTFIGVGAFTVAMCGAAFSGEGITEGDLYGPITTDSGSETVRDLGPTTNMSAPVSRPQALNFAQPQLHHTSTDVWDTPIAAQETGVSRQRALDNAQVLHGRNSEDIVK